jgi:hypothetical protein
LIITTASSVILPLNKLLADDPNKAKIIATAAIPKINANILGETDSKLNTLILLKKYITIQFFKRDGKFGVIVVLRILLKKQLLFVEKTLMIQLHLSNELQDIELMLPLVYGKYDPESDIMVFAANFQYMYLFNINL